MMLTFKNEICADDFIRAVDQSVCNFWLLNYKDKCKSKKAQDMVKIEENIEKRYRKQRHKQEQQQHQVKDERRFHPQTLPVRRKRVWITRK